MAPRLAAKVFDDYRSGNLPSSREAQLGLLPLIRAIGVGRFPVGLKETMRLIGHPVGRAKEPLPPLSREETQLIVSCLKEAGLSPKDG